MSYIQSGPIVLTPQRAIIDASSRAVLLTLGLPGSEVVGKLIAAIAIDLTFTASVTYNSPSGIKTHIFTEVGESIWFYGATESEWLKLSVDSGGTVTGPASSNDGQLVVFNGSTGQVVKELAAGTTGQVLTMGASVPGWEWSGVLQLVTKQLNSSGTTTVTTPPSDDTIPQNTEGTEILTVSLIPKSAASTLFVIAQIYFAADPLGPISKKVMLFRDSTANALTAVDDVRSQTDGRTVITLLVKDPSNAALSTTFKMRVSTTGGTLRWNGSTVLGTRIFGDIPKSWIWVVEVEN